ncbi:hypothetical protein CF68_33155 [Cupriavidus sp. SK-4]|uniref:hypothetical protein n=1 Tax=Cupriavidus sp. SK-4 TaxID=574750 RepID=UPI000448FADE|nr:hypothetical protein [Cupriavidus sp. SK-4]EYS89535.1 hypothetical protein CF68_33155 [Cupriavidus sp. SK-4]
MTDRDEGMARSGRSNLFGKMTAEIPKVKVSWETREALEARATEVGMSLSEFVRELLMVSAHGEDFMKSIYAERISVVARKG